MQQSVQQIINYKRKGALIPTSGNYHVKFNVLTLVKTKGSQLSYRAFPFISCKIMLIQKDQISATLKNSGGFTLDSSAIFSWQ